MNTEAGQSTEWTSITFGKHKGKTWAQVLWCDPDYLFWYVESDDEVPEQVAYLAQQARSLKLPDPQSVVVYRLQPRDLTLASATVIPSTRAPQETATCIVKDVIDLGFARTRKQYDKSGGQILVQLAKKTYFGDPSYRVTKGRAASFYDSMINPINLIQQRDVLPASSTLAQDIQPAVKQ